MTSMNNRLTKLFEAKTERLCNIYFTAGYPNLNDTVTILNELQEHGADLVEIGMPYSDPLADGPTIQKSSTEALQNGLTLEILFEQIAQARKTVTLPLILMGYVNQLMQYGIVQFIEKCSEVGIDGLIIPDLPPEVFEEEYQDLFEQHNIAFTFLITPQTEDARITKLDTLSTGFLYVVSSASITGAKKGISDEQIAYFKRIKPLIKSPKLIGFGISDRESFNTASQYAEGAIVGSAFIKMLGKDGVAGIKTFMKALL